VGRCTVQKSRLSSNLGVIAPWVRTPPQCGVALGYDVGKISAGCLSCQPDSVCYVVGGPATSWIFIQCHLFISCATKQPDENNKTINANNLKVKPKVRVGTFPCTTMTTQMINRHPANNKIRHTASCTLRRAALDSHISTWKLSSHNLLLISQLTVYCCRITNKKSLLAREQQATRKTVTLQIKKRSQSEGVEFSVTTINENNTPKTQTAKPKTNRLETV